LASDYALTSATANSAAASASITTAPLAVTADNQTRPVLTPNPPLTVTYSGLQAGDTSASLGGALVVTTPATVLSPAGTYPITPSGLTSGDYVIAFNSGILTVTVGPATPVGISAFSAFSGAIASTINPPGAAPTGLTAPGTADSFVIMMAAAGGSATIQQISPTISIYNCGIRSPLAGCDPQ
jgi:hypothetical protein